MKESNQMKHTLFLSLLALVLFIGTQAQASGQEVVTLGTVNVQQDQAREELKQAAYAYRDGKFAEAQQHAERALELDPQNKDVPFFIARSIHAQYRTGITTPENIAKAYEAVSAYQKILQSDPSNEEAYKAVAAIYGALREDELQRAWILQRALNPAISDDRRAEAYTVLASQDWNCSYAITELPGSKQTVNKNGKAAIRYSMPKDQHQFLTAEQCAASGLQMAETAISLDPQNDTAWSFKTNLLLEMAKLAEMSGQDDLKAEYERQAAEAQQRTSELTEVNQRAVQEREMKKAASAAQSGSSQTGTSTTIHGGILNSKAVSLPKPDYPQAARDARASGTVTVQVLIDESGNVIKATAVSGHPLLQAAAVEAARQAKFSPTFLSGQRVRLTGVLAYNFVP
jgi:TonB family protein